MTQIQPDIRIRLQWHGPREYDKLRLNLVRGLIKTTNHYKAKIQALLLQTAGSDPVSGNLRIRRRHSSENNEPFWQTKNLGLSITTSYTLGKEVLHSRISTRVKYAPTLEKGGQLSTNPDFKKFTTIRLVNPLKSTPFISPRPAWIPVFERENKRMVTVIVQTSGKRP